MSAVPTSIVPRLAHVGEQFSQPVRYTREDIFNFARLTGDTNPLHVDLQAAQRARFGEIIASGQQTASLLMGLLAAHFSRHDDGVRREMLCVNTNFAFKEPLFADQDIQLTWKVASAEWKPRIRSMLVHLDGHASVTLGKPAVIARGTILVKEAG